MAHIVLYACHDGQQFRSPLPVKFGPDTQLEPYQQALMHHIGDGLSSIESAELFIGSRSKRYWVEDERKRMYNQLGANGQNHAVRRLLNKDWRLVGCGRS